MVSMRLSLLCLVDLKDEGAGQEGVVASLKASGAPGESLVPVLSNRCADRTSPGNHQSGSPFINTVSLDFYDMRSLVIMLSKVT